MDTNTHQGVSVHAGFPNPAADRTLEGLDLHKLLIRHQPSTFFMRIDGRSGEASGIFDKDVVIIDRALAPHKTDLLIWWNGEEFVIGQPAQVPANCQEWGVVTAVIHQYRS
jgi:SOS-response transcriptional repressor LexA